MRQRHFIDSQKAVTSLFVLALIAIYNQWQNPTAWIYLALHGTYPDRQWEQPAGWAYGLAIWGGLCTYWVAAWLLVWRGVQAPAWYLGMCVSLYTFGIFLHFVADMQKFTALNLNPDHLITDGLFSRVRNINYFGELLIYAGFGLLAMHWLPVVILLAWNVIVWLPNMRKKDRSLGRYPEFAAYKERTKFYIPFLF